MMLEWTTRRITETLGLEGQFPDYSFTGITTDSRAVKPGQIFIAIRGDRHDGHDFIPQAIAAGAKAIISEQAGSHPEGVFFKVPSCMEAIGKLAQAHRKGFKIPVIGVVGAVGKTTTKELIASILGGKHTQITKTEGSQNGFLGIPLTLLQIKADTEIAVVEIGIDEIGAMEQHLKRVEPTHLILTRTGPEHLHQLKTLEIAAAEELKAFDYALEHRVPIAINLSDPFVSEWVKNHEKELKNHPNLTYSLSSKDHPALLGRYLPAHGTLTLEEKEGPVEYPCPLPGEHHAHNLLAAISVCRFFHLTPLEIQSGIAQFKTAYGRTEIHALQNGIEVIGDYYNSNPTSLEAALVLLMERKTTADHHAVLGDMLELGEHEERFHRDAASALIRLGVEQIWLYGPRMKWLQNELEQRHFGNCRHFETHEALTSALRASLQPDARVLIKGSRGMKMESVLKGLKSGGPTP